MRREVIEKRIPYLSLMGMKINRINEFKEGLESLIRNRTIIHNDELNIDYIVLGISVSEEIFSQDYKVRLTIDILDDIDKDIQHQLKQLETSLMNFYQLNDLRGKCGKKDEPF